MKFFSFFSLLVFSSISNSAIISTNFGQGSDAFVRGGTFSDINYGTSDYLVFKDSPNISFTRKTWIKFDLSSISSDIIDSELILTVARFGGAWPNPDKTHTFDIYGLNDNVADWNELDITWNNAPGNLGGNNVVNATKLGNLSTLTSVAFGDQLVLKTPELNDFILADTNNLVTLILIDTTPALSGVQYSTKENAIYDAPLLNLTTVPVPTAFWLLFSGLLGLVRIKKGDSSRG